MKRLNLFEFPKHAALIALGQPWLTADHLADLLSACDLGMDLGHGDERIFSLASTAREFLVAGVESGDMALQNADNLDQIRRTLGEVVQWISNQPNRAVHDAVIKRLRALNEQERVS